MSRKETRTRQRSISPAAWSVGASMLLVTACGSTPTPVPSHIITRTGRVFDVTTFGARSGGFTDNTTAFASAIAAAEQAGGGTIYVPAGHYAFSATKTGDPSSVVIKGSAPVTLEGAGRDATYLVEMHPSKGLLGVQVDGSVIENLTLDTQTHGGGVAIFVRANNTRFLDSRVLGGSRTFALYYAGPKGAKPLVPAYNTGNTVDNLDLNELDCNDGFSWSFQANSTISNITHTGSRLALYIDKNTTVSNYHYVTGSQQCGARNGFWITPPSVGITITNFTSNGEGGKVGVIGAKGAGKVAQDVTINGLTLTGTGSNITIGDVKNLLLENSNLGANDIVVSAQAVAQGSITHCTFAHLIHSSAAGAQVAISVASG
jgi:Pectate lyase superfamily protein